MRVKPVNSLVAVTFVPRITAPDGSVTYPRNVPVVTCAAELTAIDAINNIAIRGARYLFVIMSLLVVICYAVKSYLLLLQAATTKIFANTKETRGASSDFSNQAGDLRPNFAFKIIDTIEQ